MELKIYTEITNFIYLKNNKNKMVVERSVPFLYFTKKNIKLLNFIKRSEVILLALVIKIIYKLNIIAKNLRFYIYYK